MKNLLWGLFFLLPLQALAQSHCYTEMRTETTDWRDSSSTNDWNWLSRNTNFRIPAKPFDDMPQGDSIYLSSPFYPESVNFDSTRNLYVGVTSGMGNNAPLWYELDSSFYGVDAQPEDGWELLYKAMEVDELPPGNTPYRFFAMYNRRASLLRVFVFTDLDIGQSADVLLRLSFHEDSKKTALLAAVNPVQQSLDQFFPNNQFIKDVGSRLLQNDYVVNFADFILAYDPCTCAGEAEIQLDILPVPTEGPKAIRRTHDRAEELLMPNYHSSRYLYSPKPAPYTNSLAGGNNSYTFGWRFHQLLNRLQVHWNRYLIEDHTGADYWQDIVPLAYWQDRYSPLVGQVQPFLWEEKWNSIQLMDSLALDNRMLAHLGSAYNHLTGAWRADDLGVRTGLIFSPIYQDIAIEGGELPEPLQSTKIRMRLPGSQPPASPSSETLEPIYDNTLGVFNLLEAPKLEMVPYQQEQVAGDLDPNIVGTRFYEYKLADSLQFLINPAAQLRPIRMFASMQYIVSTESPYSIGYSYGSNYRPNNFPLHGPVLLGPVKREQEGKVFYEDVSTHYFQHNNWDDIRLPREAFVMRDLVRQYGGGQELSIWPDSYAHPNSSMDSLVFQTPLVALPDMHKYSFRLWDHPANVDMVLKIYAFYVPEDDPTREPLLQIHSFRIGSDLVQRQPAQKFSLTSNGMGGYSHEIAWADQSPYADNWKADALLPFRNQLVLEGLNFGAIEWRDDHVYIKESGSIVAGNIYIDTPIELAPGVQVTLYAYRTELGNNFGIPPGLSIRSMETNPTVAQASVEAVSQRCASMAYQELRSERRAAPADLGAQLFPNPAKEQAVLSYSLTENAPVRISMVDVLGRSRLVLDEMQSAGTHQQTLRLEQLPPGIYYCRLEIGDAQQLIPLRVQ